MKHLLNNLTEQEKNSIREQHTGGMKVSNYRFKELLENKLGNSKPLVEKFYDEDDTDFEDEELYSGAPERLVKHMDSGKIVGTHKHGVGYTPNKHGRSLGHSNHPTSIPNFTKFDDEDDYDFEGNVETHLESRTKRHYLINEQTTTLGKIARHISGTTKTITGKPINYSGTTNSDTTNSGTKPSYTGSTASSPAREQVVNDCIRQIFYVMAKDKETLYDEAKTTKYGSPSLFANGEIPTEEEWSLAQEKFIMINLKGVFNLD
jgi:hypothetical protein